MTNERRSNRYKICCGKLKRIERNLWFFIFAMPDTSFVTCHLQSKKARVEWFHGKFGTFTKYGNIDETSVNFKTMLMLTNQAISRNFPWGENLPIGDTNENDQRISKISVFQAKRHRIPRNYTFDFFTQVCVI